MADVVRYNTKGLAITREGNIWHVRDKTSGKRITFVIDQVGTISFNSCAKDFNYEEAFETICDNVEGRTLCVICEKKSSKERILNKVSRFRKVPSTSTISTRIYYSK